MKGDDPTKRRQQIVKNVKKQNGSTDWAYDKRNGRYGSGTNNVIFLLMTCWMLQGFIQVIQMVEQQA